MWIAFRYGMWQAGCLEHPLSQSCMWPAVLSHAQWYHASVVLRIKCIGANCRFCHSVYPEIATQARECRYMDHHIVSSSVTFDGGTTVVFHRHRSPEPNPEWCYLKLPDDALRDARALTFLEQQHGKPYDRLGMMDMLFGDWRRLWLGTDVRESVELCSDLPLQTRWMCHTLTASLLAFLGYGQWLCRQPHLITAAELKVSVEAIPGTQCIPIVLPNGRFG